MPKRAVRIHADLDQRMQRTAKDRGYRTPSAFIRAAIESEVKTRNEVSSLEEQMAASIDRLAKEVRRVARLQQGLFAMLDALTKAFLTCTPEPAADTRASRIALAKIRYGNLVKAAGQEMARGGGIAWEELLNHGEE